MTQFILDKTQVLVKRMIAVRNILLWGAVLVLLSFNNIPNYFDQPTNVVVRKQTIYENAEECFSFDKVKELLDDPNFGEPLNVQKPVGVNKSTNKFNIVKLTQAQESKIIKSENSIPQKEWRSFSKEKRSQYYDSYIIRFWNIAHTEYEKTGVHPLLILGRGARESQCATSKLYMATQNMFCIKWTKKLNNTSTIFGNKDYKVFSDDKPNDRFIVFGNTWESIRGFCQFVKKKKYIEHLQWGSKNIKNNSLKQWSHALCEGGYSTYCVVEDDVKAGERILKRAKALGLPMYMKDYNLR